MNTNKIIIINIIGLVSITTLAIELYLPAFQVISVAFHTTTRFLQLSISVFLLCAACASLVFGVLSDLYGRQKIIYLCLVIALFGTGIILLSDSISFFLIGRSIQGIAAGGLLISAKAIARDHFFGKELNKIISIVLVAISIISIITPLIGGYILIFSNWHMIFLVLMIYILLLLIYNRLFVSIKSQIIKEKFCVTTAIKRYINILIDREFIRLLSILILIYSLDYIYNTVVPVLLATQFHFSPARIGEYMSGLTFFEIFGMVLSIFLNRLLHPVTIATIGILLGLAANIILLIFDQIMLAPIVLLVILFGLSLVGSGMTYPNIMGELLKIRVTQIAMLVSITSVAEKLFASIVTALISLLHISSVFGLAAAFVLVCSSALALMFFPRLGPTS